MRKHCAAENQTRRIVKKILRVHGLQWQENIHGKMIADEMGITKFLEQLDKTKAIGEK